MHPLVPRIAFLAAATAAVSTLVNSVVPEPYLDEVFHIPQAQAYCAGRFDIWDPKLTTPAGLYLLSYPLSLFTACTPAVLRGLNSAGVALALPLLAYRIVRVVHPALARAAAAHTALNVALFPLLFFFAGLYYTDVFSAVLVLASYLLWLQRRPWCSAAAAWAGLWFRQTNVLWAVFLAVLEGVRALEVAQGPEKPEAVVEEVAPVVEEATPAVTPVASPAGKRRKRKGRAAPAPPQAPTPPALSRVNSRLAEDDAAPPPPPPVQEEGQESPDGPWTINVQSAPARSSELSQAWSRVTATAAQIRIHNPPFTHAVTLHDFLFSTPVSILLAALQHPAALLRGTAPYLCVLASFAAFVLWNERTLVLGDKAAHAPTLHIPQLFYFAAFTLLASSPLLASPRFLRSLWAATVGVHVRLPRRPARGKRARKLPPGFAPAATAPLVAVDWAALLRTACALAAVLAAVHTNTVLHPYLLADNRHFVFYVFRRVVLVRPWARYALAPGYVCAGWGVVEALRGGGAVSVVWGWGWGAAVAGTLLGAGLVEGRYFVLGWVLWRVHVVGEGGAWRRWAETAAFVGVDVAVLWVFLRWGFVWEGVQGVQRFMW